MSTPVQGLAIATPATPGTPVDAIAANQGGGYIVNPLDAARSRTRRCAGALRQPGWASDPDRQHHHAGAATRPELRCHPRRNDAGQRRQSRRQPLLHRSAVGLMGIVSKLDPRAPRPKPLATPPGPSQGPYIGVGSSAGPQAPPNPWVQHGDYISYRRGTVVGEPPGGVNGNMGDGTLNARGLYVDGVPVTFGDFVDEAGDTMTGPLVLYGDPQAALEATPKQYVDGLVGSLVAGVHMMGVFDASNATIEWNSDTGLTGNTLPDPATVTDGGYLICGVAGTTPPTGSPADPLYAAGDWLIANGVDVWFHIHVSVVVTASSVVVSPLVAGADDVQEALTVLDGDITAIEADSRSVDGDIAASKRDAHRRPR